MKGGTYTSYDRKASCKDIVAPSSRSCLSRLFFETREHLGHLSRHHVRLHSDVSLAICLDEIQSNLLTPNSLYVVSQVKLRKRFHNKLDDN